MVDNIEHIPDDWQDGSTIDVLQEMTMLAMSVVTESLFGINFRDRETFSKVNGAFTNILEHFTQINEPVKNLLDEGSESVEQNKFQDSLMEHIKKTAP